MAKRALQLFAAEENILHKIYFIRGERVMFDKDLAEMFGVETKSFNQAVKRNVNRFPKDFMFSLTAREWKNLRSQFVTSSWGGTRYRPKVFTEQGVAMLSGILNSSTAFEVNIRIIRVFTKLRKFALTHKEILLQLSKLEKDVKGNGRDIKNVFVVLKELVERNARPSAKRSRIGFRRQDEQD